MKMLSIHVSARLNQGSCDLRVSIRDATVKRGTGRVVHGIHVSSRLDQGSRDLQLSILSANMQRGYTRVICNKTRAVTQTLRST